MLAEVIGTPAMLEQTAEECVELAQACLKMARHLRAENLTHKSKEDIANNLAEEIADISICIGEVMELGLVPYEAVDSYISYKEQRMKQRLADYKEEK